VENFKAKNGVFPARVIIYRDGVADSQIPSVCGTEIQQFKQGFAQASCNPEFMFLNVNKRVNTRIFAGEQGNYRNPQPGLCVDQGITDKDTYEFYMVATSARQGMTNPTRYTIVHDSCGAPPDQIELLTYKLCYTYYNVSGSIKVPAAVQYAHRLAALVGDRGTRQQEPPKVHDHYANLSSLYFI